MTVLWLAVFVIGIAGIVWGAETFAEHLGAASVRLGISTFALGVLLAGAEPEELATVVTASLRGSPGIAIGDVIGANVAICLVALGVGAVIAPLPFRQKVLRYALAGLPVAALASWFAWDGRVDRLEGAVLVGLYILYVAVIWLFEGRPPSLGEAKEIEEAQEKLVTSEPTPSPKRVSRELILVFLGVVAMAGGSSLLVEAIQRMSGVEETQTALGLTLVGFATAFELVVLAWSAARRGASETVVAGVVGSFAYNATMTLGAGALVRPLVIQNAQRLHLPLLAMLASLILVIALAIPNKQIDRFAGVILLAAYPLFVLAVLLR